MNCYVKTGLDGWGPDLYPEDEPCTTIEEVCRVVVDELNRSIDYLIETAPTYADQGEFEDAYRCRTLADDLGNLAANLDWDRRIAAPLYAGDADRLGETMQQVIDGHFPLTVTVDGHTRLYVWDVTE